MAAHQREPLKPQPSRTVFFGNIHDDVTEGMLMELAVQARRRRI